VELIAMMVGSAVLGSLAVNAVTLNNWLSVDASLEFIAVLTSGASTIGIAGTIGNRGGGWCTWEAEVELIAVMIRGAIL
jgi:hypothetical protein